MSTTQKRWLVGRLETQALYGAKVYLLGTSGSWSHVAAAGQPTPRNRWGYPGWLPTRQLTGRRARRRRSPWRSCCRPTVWLYETAALTGRVLEVSYGTRLPVVSATDEAVEVAQAGRRARLRAARRRRPARDGLGVAGADAARGSCSRRAASSACSTSGPARPASASTAPGFTHLVYRRSA